MRSHSGNSELQLDLEIAQSGVPAPNAFGVETSGNVISFAFIEKQRPLSRFYCPYFCHAFESRKNTRSDSSGEISGGRFRSIRGAHAPSRALCGASPQSPSLNAQRHF